MISLMRKSLQSNAYRIFLWMFMIFMIIGGFAAIDFSGGKKDWAVKVYKQIITKSDWHHMVVMAQRQLEYFKQRGINWEKNESVETEVLRQSMTDTLLRHSAYELGLALPSDLLEESLEANLKGLPAHFFNEDGSLNISLFERAIAPKNFAGFVDEIENNSKADLLIKLVNLSSYVPQFAVKMQYNEDFANKSYSVLTFSLHNSLTKVKQNNVTDKALAKFYKKSDHGQKYKTAEKRAGVYWTFDQNGYGIKVSDKEIKKQYDANKKTAYLNTPSQVQVKVITFKIDNNKKDDIRELASTTAENLEKNPKEFDEIGKKLSAGKASNVTFTTTEFFGKDSKKHDQLFITTAFEKLTKDGQVSVLIKTKDGYQILQRIKRKAATYKKLAEVKSEIEKQLITKKFNQRFQQDAHRVASQARYNKDALENFAKKRGGKKTAINLETRQTSLVSNNLFRTNKNKFDIFMDGSNGILLQCLDIEKSKLKPLAEVKEEVKSHYYREQAQKDMQAETQKAMALSSKEKFESLAQKFGAELSTATFEYNDGNNKQSPVLRRYEVMQKVKMLQSPGEVIDISSKTDAMLIRLDSIAPLDKKLFEDKKDSMMSTLEHKHQFQAKDSFIASLYRHAKLNNKIEIDKELLKKVEA